MRAMRGNPMSSQPDSTSPIELKLKIKTIAETFHNRHLQTYGHDNRSEPVQIVSVRLAAIGTIPPLLVRDTPRVPGMDAAKSKRQLWFREAGAVDATIYDRRRMPPGLQGGGSGRDRIARIHDPRAARLAGENE